MTAIAATRLSFAPLFLIFLALLLFVAAVGLPLTRHAVEGHKDQAWNAVTVQQYFDAGKCQPTQYLCPNVDKIIKYCSLNAGKSIGLIIGSRVQQVITGFMADTSRWANPDKMCK